MGWGVLGSFGSSGKDEMAQVVRKAEGAHKMVKNSKGLWVKQTDTDSITVGGRGQGRGSGIPVFNSIPGHDEKPLGKTYDQRDDYRFEDNDDDIDPKKSHQSNRNRSSSRDRDTDRNRDRDRGRDRDSDRDRARDRDHRNGGRNRSRSRDRHRHSGDKSDRREDSYKDKDRHGDHERSVGRKRDRDQYDDAKHDRKYRDRSYDRDHNREREKDRDRDRKRDRERSPSQDNRRGGERETESSKEAENDVDVEEAASICVTAIQVVNRFHEVYSTDTLFAQDRITSLCALLAPSSSIRSLKTGTEYLAGPAAIGESFNKTLAAPVAVSKRVYIEPTGQDLDGTGSVSYVMDLHRAGTAPGLGDKAKDTVLFYRVKGAEIMSIWGTVDSEKLAADSDLSKDRLLGSKAWKLVSQIVVKERGSLDEAGVHYHNYDHMEVWG